MINQSVKSAFARICAEVDLDVIKENSKKIAAHIGPEVKVMAVIKSDGYGHGAIPIARVLEQEAFIYGFAVATSEEAMMLRDAGIQSPILILGYVFEESFEQLIREGIRFTVFQEAICRELSKTAEKLGLKAYVHVKVDTGMNRIGIRPDESGLQLIGAVKEMKGLQIEGIFTHYARADEAEKEATEKQCGAFQTFVEKAEALLGYQIPLKHSANSAATLELPFTHMDLVRPGIILYGLLPSEDVEIASYGLKPALSLFSHIVFIKEIEAGETVSYGGTFTADRKLRVATVPVGYGDGYPRMLSGKGAVLIHGKRAPILGRICMDQFMVDVTEIPEAAELDPVVLLGAEGEEQITAEELGALSGRFNYELVCDLGRRIPRIFKINGEEMLCREPYRENLTRMFP